MRIIIIWDIVRIMLKRDIGLLWVLNEFLYEILNELLYEVCDYICCGMERQIEIPPSQKNLRNGLSWGSLLLKLADVHRKKVVHGPNSTLFYPSESFRISLILLTSQMQPPRKCLQVGVTSF